MTAKYARRHYEGVAAVLASSRPGDRAKLGEYAAANRTWHDIHGRFVNMFAEDNARFDWERFNIACGL